MYFLCANMLLFFPLCTEGCSPLVRWTKIITRKFGKLSNFKNGWHLYPFISQWSSYDLRTWLYFRKVEFWLFPRKYNRFQRNFKMAAKLKAQLRPFQAFIAPLSSRFGNGGQLFLKIWTLYLSLLKELMSSNVL